MSNDRQASSGVGFSGLLFIVFLVLKLTNVINWSWWWITAPLWGSIALILAIIIVSSLIVGLILFFDKDAQEIYIKKKK